MSAISGFLKAWGGNWAIEGGAKVLGQRWKRRGKQLFADFGVRTDGFKWQES